MQEMKNHPLYEKMNALYDKGDIKYAALAGVQLLEAYDLLELVSPSIYEVIFDNKEKKSFYVSTVITILTYVKENKC